MKRVELSRFVPRQGLTRVEMPRKAFNLNPPFNPALTRTKSPAKPESDPRSARREAGFALLWMIVLARLVVAI